MAASACSEAEFIELVRTLGIDGTAKKLGILRRNVQVRRKRKVVK